ncbi:MAG: ABC transporter substrate-binding protein [Gammaproteobacteria bacterium]|nr:ABC transporter substrate-binding protein [Gammaproteobacteria bacterium]
MPKESRKGFSRRSFLQTTAAAVGATAVGGLMPASFAIGGSSKVRIGILLPYSGTYAMLGNSITDAFKLRVQMGDGTIAGREVEYIPIDSEMSVPKAPQNTKKLVDKEKVDFLVGPVHSGIAAVMAKLVGPREGPIMIVPNAGSNAVTGPLCADNIFRTSFSNWQPAFPGGKVMADDGHKTAITIAWKYAAGMQMMDAGKSAFEQNGGKVIKDIQVPFPNVEFQANLSEIAALKPDAVFAFFSGGGAVKFVKDYAAAGLKDKIPLYGPGFLTEGVSKAQGAAAEGIRTTLHYSGDLENSANQAFRRAYDKAYGKMPNVFSVQGYDAAALIINAMTQVGGDSGATGDLINAMSGAKFPDSPRGAWHMSAAHNPVQNIYLREVRGGKQKLLGIAAKDLEDPAKGCKMA